MSDAVTAIGRRYLPRGWGDLGRQLAIWFGFYVLYQMARGLADRDVAVAFENGLKVIDIEQKLGSLFELSLQSVIDSSDLLIDLASWTYWLSQFAVLGLALLWVYLRHTDRFFTFRNTILVANLIGLVGYVLVPTAPPRMFPDVGFVDTLALFSTVDHSSAAVEWTANPYAAMPSLHGADSLIVGIAMALIVRRLVFRVLWLAWPVWVSFIVMATGNHFWLDIAAGWVVAAMGAAIVFGWRGLRRRRAIPAAP